MKRFKSLPDLTAPQRVFGRVVGHSHQSAEKIGASARASWTSLGIILALLAGVFSAFAQPYTIDWYTVDGGGGLNGTGGPYTLSGTIGQPDAGIMGGGALDGGFWGLFGPLQPLLTIERSSANVIISWPSPSTGFVLQEITDLVAGVWSNVAQVPTDNGTTKSMTTPASGTTKYYRLRNP